MRPHDGAARRPARRAPRCARAGRSRSRASSSGWSGAPPPSSTPGPTRRDSRGRGAAQRCGACGPRAPPTRAHAIVLDGVDLDLRAGEILGIAGLVGSGRTELARAIFGADPIAAGTIILDGAAHRARPRPPTRATSGSASCPRTASSRRSSPCCRIRQNFSIAALDRYSNRLGFMAGGPRERAALADYRKAMSIRMASPEQAIDGLSGGNQQKVILARWLARDPKVLIVDEPTRGVDVGAKAEVHQILVQLAERGIAILMISSELPEVLSVSDRIVTMRQGRITGEMPAVEATEEKLMALMALDTAAQGAAHDLAPSRSRRRAASDAFRDPQAVRAAPVPVRADAGLRHHQRELPDPAQPLQRGAADLDHRAHRARHDLRDPDGGHRPQRGLAPRLLRDGRGGGGQGGDGQHAVAVGERRGAGYGWGAALLAAVAVGTLAGCVQGLVITRLQGAALRGDARRPHHLPRAHADPLGRRPDLRASRPRCAGSAPGSSGRCRCRSSSSALAALLCHVVLRYTRFGRAVYAVGGNAEAARLSGVRVDRVLVSVYMIVGFFSGLAAFVLVRPPELGRGGGGASATS